MANFCGKCGSRLDGDTGRCPRCDREKIPGRRGRKRVASRTWLAVVVVLAVIILLGLFAKLGYDALSRNAAGFSADASVSGSSIAPAGTESLGKDRPTLRSDYEVPSGGEDAMPVYNVFGSTVEKEKIVSMKFLNSLADAPADAWDVSEAGDHSVLAWVTPTDDQRYDLFIAGDGGVWAPEDCTYLFAEYRWMDSLDFNDAFFVDQCKTMKGMFFHDQFLAELDLSGWDTSSVTDMSEMFYFCSGIKKLDLSRFDTSTVTDMNSMFNRCESIENLDLSGFDTSHVTDMSSMFFQAWNLAKLNVGGFDTSLVTDMSFMFSQVWALDELDLSSFDTSSVEDSLAFLAGGVAVKKLTIGPKFDVTILRNAAESIPFMAENGTINGYPWKDFLHI